MNQVESTLTPGAELRLDTEPRDRAVEAEESVLGGVLLDPSMASVAFGILGASDFTVSEHRHIAKAMRHIINRGDPVDTMAVHAELKRTGSLEAAGGAALLSELLDAVPTAAHVEPHAHLVRERAERRRVGAETQLLLDRIRSGESLEEVREDGLDVFGSVKGRALFQFLTTAELQDRQSLEWLVEGVIPAGGLALLVAPPAHLKTFVLLDLALTLSTGKGWWLGSHRAASGPVVFVSAEYTHGLKDRVAAWMEFHSVTDPGPIWFVTMPVQLNDPQAVSAFLMELEAVTKAPSLIIFDTWARSTVGIDENLVKDVGPAIANCDRIRERTGATVMLAHHTIKHDGKVERGSTALRGAADLIMTIEGDQDERVIKCSKLKDGEHFSAIPIQTEMAAGSLVITARDAMAVPDGKLTSAQLDILGYCHDCAPSEGLTTSKWESICGLPERTFYRAKKALLDGGFVDSNKIGHGALYRPTAKGIEALTANCQITANLLPGSGSPNCLPADPPLGGPHGGSDRGLAAQGQLGVG